MITSLKKHQMIERLLIQTRNEREYDRLEIQLIFTTADEVRKIYIRQEPKLVAMGEPYRRVIRRQARRAAWVAKLHMEQAWFAERAKRWVHPKKKYPLEPMPEAPPVLQFGLSELYETALWLWLHKGDKDAAATCKMIGVRPKHRPSLHCSVDKFHDIVRRESFPDELHAVMEYYPNGQHAAA